MKFSRTIAIIGLVPAATAFTATSVSHRGSSLAMAESSIYSADIAKALDNEVSLRQKPGGRIVTHTPDESKSRTHVRANVFGTLSALVCTRQGRH